MIRVMCLLLVAPLTCLEALDPGTGEAIFSSNCANCHGSDGSGGRGPSLRGTLRNGNQQADIKNVIRNGLPGTAMPKFDFEEDELRAVAGYVQSLSHGAIPRPHPAGDAMAGKRLYDDNGCAGCHRIGNGGSTFGPNLTRVGVARSYDYLKSSITEPSKDVPDDYQGIIIVDHEGKKYRGAWVNEDSFTIQIRLPDQSFASFDKQSLQEETHEKTSLMPDYKFSAGDLTNLLSYLSSLTGTGSTDSEAGRRPRLR